MKYCRSQINILAASLVYTILGCSSSPQETEIQRPANQKLTTPTMSIETSQVAAEQSADDVIELTFKKKSVELSQENQARLRKLLLRAKKSGELFEIKVISWADKEYPSASQKKLSRDQQKIADARNKSIENFIHEQSREIKVQTFNMAERAHFLKEFIGTSEARIKNSLELAGIPTTHSAIQFPPKASKSIILIKVK